MHCLVLRSLMITRSGNLGAVATQQHMHRKNLRSEGGAVRPGWLGRRIAVRSEAREAPWELLLRNLRASLANSTSLPRSFWDSARAPGGMASSSTLST